MPSPHRVLLLTTTHSYRNDAFQRAAVRLGVEVVPAVDMAPAMAEQWKDGVGISLSDPGAAVAAIVAYAERNPLDAILAVDDAGVIVAANAAAQLGLPHNAPAAAEAARDKYLMRTRMAAAGVPCPWFRRFSTGDDPHHVAAQIPYPCVVKPTNLNGSRGVIRADDPPGFVAAVRRLARMLVGENPDGGEQPYLVESFIPGFEVALEGMLDQGELTVLALFDKPDPLDGPYFEETIYVTPSRLAPAVQAEIAACAGRAARAIGLHSGPIHAELRVNAEGPWMLEVAGRSIGGLCGQTLRFDMGTTLEEIILRQACGLPWQHDGGAGQASGVMMIPIPEAGQLVCVEGVEAAAAVPGVDSVEITTPLHHTVTPLPEGDSYLGFIFARAATPAAVETALRTAHGCLHFQIVPEFVLSV
jgi:biotin carboxylase